MNNEQRNAARRLAARNARRLGAMEAMQRRHDAALAAAEARLSVLTAHERAVLLQAAEIQARLDRYDALQGGTLASMELTARTAKALAAAGITTREALAALTDVDILSIPNLGRKALREIRDALT